MKHLLFVILEENETTAELLRELSNEGYNGTVISSTSLKHVLHDQNEDTPFFINLSMIHSNNFVENTIINLVLDEEDLEIVKNIIRKYSEGFTKIKGGMYSTLLESYEGSF